MTTIHRMHTLADQAIGAKLGRVSAIAAGYDAESNGAVQMFLREYNKANAQERGHVGFGVAAAVAARIENRIWDGTVEDTHAAY